MEAAWQNLEGLRIDTVATSLETANSTFGPFRCNRYGLTWIVEGGGTTWLDRTGIVTQPGTIILMRPGMVLRHDWGKRRSFQSFIVFDFDALGRGWPAIADWPLYRQLEPGEFAFSLFRYVIAGEHTEAERACTVYPAVELLLQMFLSGKTSEHASTSPALSPPVERALGFIQARLQARADAPVSLPQVARQAHVTIQHLCRLFKRELGASPMQCVRLMRIELAATLLERTENTLSEVAERLGYSSQFHLSKNFKEHYGVAPSEYRKAFHSGLIARPGGLLFRHHPLRRYLYERAPGKIGVRARA